MLHLSVVRVPEKNPECHMKRVIITATALALLGIVMLTFAMCEGQSDTPESPSYLPAR